MSDPEYSVVIPVYNSAESLEQLNDRLIRTLEQTGANFEIIYTDDASPDNSWETIRRLCERYPMIRAIRMRRNIGQWMALLAGTSVARGRHIIHMDDDLEYDPEDILLLIDKYNSGPYRIVYGIPPEKARKNWSNRLLFRFRSHALDFLLGKYKTESFRIFHYRVVLDPERIPLSFLHFEAQAKRTVHQREVGYTKVSYRNRPHGKSGYSWPKKFRMIARYGPEHALNPKGTTLSWGLAWFTLLFCGILAVHGAIGLPLKMVGLALIFASFASALIFLAMLRYLLKKDAWQSAIEIADHLN